MKKTVTELNETTIKVIKNALLVVRNQTQSQIDIEKDLSKIKSLTRLLMQIEFASTDFDSHFS